MWASKNTGDSNKQIQLNPFTPLLNYSFLMPLLLRYLTDEDVLTRLLSTGKIMKPCLIDYPLITNVTPEQAQYFTRWTRYLPVKITSIRDYDNEDLRFYSSLQSLIAHEDFDAPFPLGVLPLSLKNLDTGISFDKPVPVGVLPPGLEAIKFGYWYNQPLCVDALPHSLTSVMFSCNFNQQILPGLIPDSVKKLRLGQNYRHPESGEDSEFNLPLIPGAVPNIVTDLMLGQRFNQSFTPGSLPSSLRILSFGLDFNQPLTADIIPQGLTSLTLGEKFANVLCLPPSLTKLQLKGSNSKIQFSGGFPSSLVTIDLGPEANVLPVGLLPNSLKKVTVRQSIVVGSLPSSIAVLEYHANAVIPAGAIPETVKVLELGGEYNQPLLPGVVPNSVTHLLFGGSFNQLLVPGSTPESVTHISLGGHFNQLFVPGSLPESLTCLKMGRKDGIFDQQLLTFDVKIPLSVLSDIAKKNNQTSVTIGSIPQSVTHLILSRDYNKPLLAGSLPDSLTHLALGNQFAQPLSADVFPSSLKLLVVSGNTVVNVDPVDVRTIASSVDPDWWHWPETTHVNGQCIW